MRSTRISRRTKRTVGALAGLLVALTGLVGFAHTKPGRPLLGWMGRAMGRHSAGCPLGYDRAATPEQREAARAGFAASHRGLTASAARPALGFALDHTTRDDVLAWASAHDVVCVPGGGMADLRCESVPDALVPSAFRGADSQAVSFTFGEGGRLVTVVAAAHADRPEAISAAFANIVTDLDRETGASARVEGDPSAAKLSSAALYQASAEYRFADYYAVARATNVGPGNFAITEEYRSLPN